MTRELALQLSVIILALCESVGLVIMIWQRINTMKAVRKRIKNQFIIKLK